MDFKKEMKNAWEASIPSNIILAIILLLTFIITNLTDSTIMFEIPIILHYLIYFSLFLYAGFRATYNGKGSKITAGLAGSTCAVVIGVLDIIILTIAMIMVMGSEPDAIPEELATQLGGEAAASTVVLLVAVIVLAIVVLISAIINFAIGMLGGIIGEKLGAMKK